MEIFKNLLSVEWFLLMEKEAMELEEGVVIEDILNAYIVREWDTPKRTITLYMAFLTRKSIFPKLKVLRQSPVMKNIRNI